MTNLHAESIQAPCPLCDSRDGRPAFGSRRPEYRRCNRCDLLFVTERVDDHEARTVYSSDYYTQREGTDANTAATVATFRRLTAARHLERIESLIERGSLLDVGCGEGYFLQEARHRGWRDVFGLDVSDAAARLTHRSVPALVGSLTRGPFRDHSFDVVAMFDSIEHVLAPKADIAEAARILKPGGLLYVVTPDAGGWAARSMGASWFQLKPREHVTLFSRKNLSRALTDAGFSRIRITSGRKLLSLSFVHTILRTTNPRLASWLKICLGATPLWNRIVLLPTGDMVAVARRTTQS